jgi:hypothetical protein
MSRKRSLKNRYLRFLRRIWPAPTLAAFTLSVGACASPLTNAGSRTVDAAAIVHPPSNTADELRYDRKPLPARFRPAPEFRSTCTPNVGLPPSLALGETNEVVNAFEPIASCLTAGSLATPGVT